MAWQAFPRPVTAWPSRCAAPISRIIVPAVLRAQGQPGDLLDNAVRENVRRTVLRLRTAEALLADPVKAGKLKIVGARYDLDDGSVDFFEEG